MSKESSVMRAWEATIRKTHEAKKRANSILGTIYLTHGEEEEQSGGTNEDDHNRSGEVYIADKVLPNGDYYTGQWYDNFPHGQGKYLWTDGCMYIGEWIRGKSMGMGRFTWPTGATYEGKFKNGYMDGKGRYTGPTGETYKGQWAMNLKHGQGVKNYFNGDFYEGEWKSDLQDGQGKYQWMDGSCYVGEWSNGSIWGEGSFVWSNGNNYCGLWEDGMPKGNGTFTFPDGSCYVGNWSKDTAEQNLTYYPSESSESSEDEHQDWDPQQIYNDLSEYRICPGEKVQIMPSQKKLAIWRSSKAADVKPRRMSLDGRASLCVDRSVDRMQMWDGAGNERLSNAGDRTLTPTSKMEEEIFGLQIETGPPRPIPGLPMKLPRKSKRQGELICRGHKNYELMLNLQLGIRHSVGRPAPAASLDLKPTAFDPKEKMWTRFPPEGSKYTPPHQSSDFKWKDYCPVVFRALRKLFKIDPAVYMRSICGNALREFSSPGKSGSFFYLTNDDRYMIKTMKKAEVKVLIRMLYAYYNHVRAHESTLFTKFYGLHCVKLNGPTQKKVRFIIMGNFFCTEYPIHRRFDLKGSSLGRITDKPETEIDDSTILKDLDLNFIFRFQNFWFEDFCRQVDRDCELLEQEGIMDYSLLVGIHFRDVTEEGDLIACEAGNTESDGAAQCPKGDMDQFDPSRVTKIKLGVNFPARVEKTLRTTANELQLVGDPTGEFYDVILYFGIIDILQDYDISKKLEHAYKSFQYDPTSISAVDPKQYSRRFRDFIFRIFGEDI